MSENLANFINHVRGVAKNSVIGEAYDFQALRNHTSVALLIMMPPFVLAMDATIAFDYKICFAAIKVSDVIADLMLPPELESKESSIPQHSPKEFFCGSLVLPKFASEGFLSRGLKPTAIVSACFH
jgi:hypothetical protein